MRLDSQHECSGVAGVSSQRVHIFILGDNDDEIVGGWLAVGAAHGADGAVLVVEVVVVAMVVVTTVVVTMAVVVVVM